MVNYSFKEPEDIKNNKVIEFGNFSQLIPNTEIMKDLTLTIKGGNFTNVKKQPGWIIKGGNFTQINRCTHLHPELIKLGLKECEVKCKHLINTDEVWIDDELIETIYTYEDERIW